MPCHSFQTYYAFFFLCLLTTVTCLPSPSRTLSKRSSSGPLVFAHYMIVEQPPNGDYTNDIKLAKDAGIDAFAINYGGWNADWVQMEGQLAKFYSQAASLNFKVFLNFDLTSVTDPNMIVHLINLYHFHDGQLIVDNKPMLSTFQTNPPAWDWHTAVLSKLITAPLFIPGTMSEDPRQAYSSVESFADGVFPWIHTGLTATDDATLDSDYASNRTATGKKWMASVAPWFFKRFSPDMNWANKQDDGIFVQKWLHLLQLKPDFIEIVTWNDWGESSYIGPANPAAQNGNDRCYWSSYNHNAFLKMTKYFTKAFHAGETSVTVDKGEEDVFMFYRTQPAMTNGVNQALPLPDYASNMHDNVFVVSFLNEPASVSLTSTGNAPITYTASAGVGQKPVLFSLGYQTLCAERQGDSFKVNKQGPAISGQWADYNGNVVAV